MSEKLDRLVLEARRAADKRAEGYREKALKIYPWICGRCARSCSRVCRYACSASQRRCE